MTSPQPASRASDRSSEIYIPRESPAPDQLPTSQLIAMRRQHQQRLAVVEERKHELVKWHLDDAADAFHSYAEYKALQAQVSAERAHLQQLNKEQAALQAELERYNQLNSLLPHQLQCLEQSIRSLQVEGETSGTVGKAKASDDLDHKIKKYEQLLQETATATSARRAQAQQFAVKLKQLKAEHQQRPSQEELLAKYSDQPDVIQHHVKLSRSINDVFIALHELQHSEVKEVSELEVMECKEVVEIEQQLQGLQQELDSNQAKLEQLHAHTQTVLRVWNVVQQGWCSDCVVPVDDSSFVNDCMKNVEQQLQAAADGQQQAEELQQPSSVENSQQTGSQLGGYSTGGCQADDEQHCLSDQNRNSAEVAAITRADAAVIERIAGHVFQVPTKLLRGSQTSTTSIGDSDTSLSSSPIPRAPAPDGNFDRVGK